MTHFAMPVSTYMMKPVFSVTADTTLESVYRVLSERGVSCVPVVEPGGRAIGVLSRTDLIRLGRRPSDPLDGTSALSWSPATAADKLHHEVVTLPSDAPVVTAARTMVKQRIHRVFVADGGELTGVFSTKEVLVAIRDKRVATPIGSLVAHAPYTIPVAAQLSQAIDRLSAAHVSGIVVVDEEHWPVGMFSQFEALLSRDRPATTPLQDTMSYAMLCLHAATPLYRAAAHAHATRARRVLVIEDRRVTGVLTGLDFARAVMGA